MKRIIIILCVLWSACSSAQPPTVLGYQTINNKFVYLGIGASALNVPAGGSAAFATSQWVRSGALYYDSTGTDTGLYVSHGTKWVKVGGATSANNGTTLGSGGIVNLGQDNSDATSASIFTATRKILVDTFRLVLQGPTSGSFPTFQNRIEFRTANLASHGAEINFLGGMGINTYLVSGTGNAFPGLAYYVDGVLQGASGLHYEDGVPTAQHFFIDGRSNTQYFAFEDVSGTSQANFGFAPTQWTTQLGLKGKVVFGSALAHTAINGDVDNVGSTYLRDSLMYAKKIFRTDTTGGDLMMVSRATPYEVKVITTADFKTAVGITSGVYTPTLTSVTNVGSSSVTTNAFHYQRVGNEVSVSGTFTVTPTAGTSLTQIAFSLPIASNLAASIDAGGVSAGTGASHFSGDFTGDSTNDRIQIDFVSTNTSAHTIYISGYYIIK